MIRQINEEQILNYKKEAERAGLVFSSSTTLYGYFVGEQLVAFSGVIIYKNKAVLKTAFVPEEHRLNGYFTALMDFTMDKVKSLGIKSIEGTCTEMSLAFFLKRGYVPIKSYKKYTKVRYEDLH